MTALLAGIVPALLIESTHLALPQLHYVNLQLHGFIELSGSWIALAVCVSLLLRMDTSTGIGHLFWIVAGLGAMGVIDGLHAQIPASYSMHWTRHLSTLAGGLLFALVWLRVSPSSRAARLLGVGIVVALALTAALATWRFGSALPVPVEAGQWSPTAWRISLAGGGGFLAAMLFFMRRCLHGAQTEDRLLIGQALLFGLSGVLFAGADPWSVSWWGWHLARLGAFAILLGAAYRTLVDAYGIAAARAAQTERNLSLIVECTDDAIIGESLDGTIRSWNRGAEQLYGYSAEDAVGRPAQMLALPGEAEEMARLMAQIARGERIAHFETRRRHKVGRVIDVSLTLSPIVDDHGTVIGASVIGRDITERKHQQAALQELNATLEQRVRERTAQLEASNKDLEGFSYSVSHDLRAPLRAIDNFSKFLLEDYADRLDAEGKRLLTVVRSNTEKMSRLIDDILAFSRAGRRELALATIDMTALVRSVYDELAPAAEARTIHLRVDPLPQACADPVSIRQVLTNLLSNAIKFTRERDVAEIAVSGELADTETRFHVTDNGVGFDPQYAHKLFGVFQRLHGTEFEGTGIGLAICKRFLDKHGGRIRAEAEPGRGASFHFSLPRREPCRTSEAPDDRESV